MVVVVIIGLLAAIAIPAFQSVQEKSRASRMANDLHQIESAFQRFAIENGTWPPPNAPGLIPTGMAPYLPEVYTQTTAAGGNFSWSGPGARIYVANCPTAAAAMMQRVDAILDDGDLTTGDFTQTSATFYAWQLK